MRPKTARRLKKSWSRMVSTVLALAMLTSLVPVTALPAYAATDVSGGADNGPPAYILNDHTPYAIHYSLSGLPASTSLGLNLRLSKSGVSGGFSDARGFTWNPTLSRWAHTRESAASSPFPFELVTTDASGNVSGWTYFKCGDETFTGFGTDGAAYGLAPNEAWLTVSLQPVGGGGTSNGTGKIKVTILDAENDGAWVHNGVATGAAAAKRAEALKSDDASISYSLHKTEANTLDDDSNGTPDDEDFGPAGATGDFRFGVPASSTMNVKLNQNPWAPGQGVSAGTADTDIALGASDHVAPAAPSGLSATPGDGSVALDWDASGDADVTGYRVYRMTPGAYGDLALQSAVPQMIASVASPTTGFTDTGRANGVQQTYLVRAVDADTNVSARSNAATATPVVLDTQAPSAVSDLAASSSGTDTVGLTWTSPGDDANTGTASAYDLRYSLSPIPDNTAFAAATEAAGEPAPQIAGSAESFSATGLAAGSHYYFALKTRDEVGNWSAISNSAEATPEAAAPATMSVNSGAEYTTIRAVTVNSEVAGATEMRVRDTAGSWSEWQPYAAEKSLTLSAGDGPKTVEAEYRNAGGAVAALSDSITLDSTGPDGIVLINGGDASTSQSGVTLNCSATDGAGLASMRYSTDGVFDSEPWQAYSASCPITLYGSNGVKTVWVQYKDTLGNVSTCSDSIILNAPYWTISQTPVANQFYAVSFADATTGWGFAGSAGIAHTTDGGATWESQSYGGAEDLRSGYAVSTSTALAGTGSGKIVRTADGGATWTQVWAGSQTLNGFSFIDASNGWAAGKNGTLLKTTDGGATWTTQASGTTSQLWTIHFIDPLVGWVTGQNGIIRKTIDGGATWTAQTSGSTTAKITGLSVVDSQTAYASGSQNGMFLFKTVNGGATWTSAAIDGGATLSDCQFLDANNGYVVGQKSTFAKIYKTTDGGATWTTQLSVEGNGAVYGVHFTDADHGWGCMGFGRIAKYSPPDVTAPFATSDLAVSGVDAAGVHLTLTAPGDDGAAGTAAAYDVRCSSTPITDDAAFDAATPVAGVDAPAAGGTLQSLTLTGLAPSTHYYFALKTRDEVLNTSALSNGVDATTPSAPTGTMSVNGGSALTASTAASITSTVTDAVEMRVREAGGAWTSWQPYSATLPFTLSSGDAEKTVEAEYRNAVGTLALSDTIELDASGPSGSIAVNGGDAETSSAGVLLTLFATDVHGVARMRLSDDGVFDTESWELYATSHGWVLPVGDGTKTVWVQYEDALGNASTYSDAIVLDATGPTVTDDAPAGWANGRASVNLTATDTGAGVLALSYSVEGSSAVGASAAGRSLAAGANHVLGLKTDGSVVSTGGGGDVSGWSGITALAAAGGFSLGLKSDGTVVATGDNSEGQCEVGSWNGVTSVDAGNDPLVAFDPSSFSVALKSDGSVEATGSNSHGQCDVSDWSDVIAVAAGGRHTIGLKRDGTAVGSPYRGDNDSWATYVAPGQYYGDDWRDLVAIDAGWNTSVGLKRDGTVVSAGGSSWHEQDVTDWTGIVAVKSGAIHTVGLKGDGTVVAAGSNNFGQRNVSSWTGIVAVACGDTVTYGLRSDGTVLSTATDLASWRLRTSVPALTASVPVGEGVTAIAYSAVDRLGNQSATQTATARIDHTAPVSSADASATYIESASITISAEDSVSAVASTHYRLDTGEWTTGTVVATTGIGSHTLEYHSTDLAGNQEVTQNVSFAVLPASHGSMAINGNASLTSTAVVTIDSDVATAVQMRLRNAGGTWSAWMPYATSVAHALDAGDGSKSVEAEYQDGSGTIWPLVDAITLDTTGPRGSVSVNNGERATASENVFLTLGATDDAGASQMRVSNDGVFDTEAWETIAAGKVWSLEGADGPKTVYVEFRDSLGNTSTCDDAITLDRAVPTASADAPSGWINESTGVALCATDTLSGILRTEYTVNGVPGAIGGAQTSLHANTEFTVGLAPDGTVKIAGVKDNGRSDAEGWTGIKAVASGQYHILGLRSDGTVAAAGDDDRWLQVSRVATWTGVTAISANSNHSMGLRDDGTVIDTLGYLEAPWTSSVIDCSGWRDIVAISAGVYHDLGLRSDGTVVSAANNNHWGQSNVATWTDIVGVAAGWQHSVGLKRDGTVVAVGGNGNGQCNVSGWTDIIAVAAGNYTTYGVRRDGTVVATGLDANGQCSDVTTWTDIVGIAAGYYHAVGLKRDGTCVATRGTKAFAGPGGLGFRETEVDAWLLRSAATSTLANVPVSAEGTTVVEYSAVDLANNRSATHAAEVRIDRTAPHTSISGLPSSGAAHGPVTFALSSYDALSGVENGDVQYALDGSGTTVSYTGPTEVAAIGQHTVTFWATDRAGNVEPSHTSTFTVEESALTEPASTEIQLTCDSATLAGYGATYMLSGRLVSGGSPLANRHIALQSSTRRTGVQSTSVSARTAADGSFSLKITPRDSTSYRMTFAGETGAFAACSSRWVNVTPRSLVTTPKAPSKMRAGRRATIYGFIKPRHAAGTSPVRIYRWRWVSGKWRAYGSVRATVRNYGSYSKYSVSTSLITGRWRLRAYALGDAEHAASWSSGFDYVTVKRR